VTSIENGAPRGLIGRVAGAVTGRVVEVVDPDVILEHVDIDAVLDRIDLNRVLERVDLNLLLERVDLNLLLERVDLNTLMGRVDIEALLADVDMEALILRSGIPDIVAQTTSQFAGSTLDLGRRQIAGLDFVVDRGVDRVMRRDPDARPQTPERLASPEQSSRSDRRRITGHYGGPVGRLLAFILDVLIATGTFTAMIAGLDYLTNAFFDSTPDPPSWVNWVGLAVWLFLYSFVCLAVAGRTPGKMLIGLRVVRQDGAPLSARSALIRTLCYPVSFLISFLGLIGIVIGRRHRALHDVVAGSAVVFDFGDRPAELPGPLSRFLDARDSEA
jgi:uncharacterized RDD family membrane protein YckC